MLQITTKNQIRQGKWWLIKLLLPLLLLTACEEGTATRTTPSLLDVHGTGARIISQQWWFLLAIGTAIVLLVTGLLCAILLRQFFSPRWRTPDLHPHFGLRWIWLGGIVLPLAITFVVFMVTVRNLRVLAAPPNPETLTVTVVGHRWWWEMQYPEQGFTTANQLYIPVGRSVRINLTATDVIHSFWVPQLHFKRDLIPGQTNSIWLQADEPGIYRSLCAEFCGQQHAQMQFLVVALTSENYEAWLANERKDAPIPDTGLARRGEEVFLSAGCIYCHMIRGTPAAGEVGPDLTHLASRLTLAAGTLENNTGNLGGWIMDPQHIKPGSLMPATPLTGEELQALLAYLNTLQ